MAGPDKKDSHLQHILELPDTYVGSTETADEPRWIYDARLHPSSHIVLCDSILAFRRSLTKFSVNARDALIRSQTVASRTPIKHIDVKCGMADGKFTISVESRW
jgi:hypothetical protein